MCISERFFGGNSPNGELNSLELSHGMLSMVGPLVSHAEEKLHLLAVQLRPWKCGNKMGL
jgi:hypothetical protein